jgi:hypothetical protein
MLIAVIPERETGAGNPGALNGAQQTVLKMYKE